MLLLSSFLSMFFGHKGIPEGCFLFPVHAFWTGLYLLRSAF